MDSPRSAYIHIPFCRRRCFYCDFPISVLGNQRRGETSSTVAAYVDVLCQEIAATSPTATCLSTIFFGGGTPSLLSVTQVQQILTQLHRQFGLEPTAEISMEMDPGTFTLDHLQGYIAAGINRISLGVQSLDDQLLAACGRFHRVADVYQAVEWLQQLSVGNWSLDLISALPSLTLETWADQLQQVIELQPHHLSIYDLTLEDQTVFGKRYQPGVAPLPTDDQTATMYRLAQAYLTRCGYDHYEVSNYALPGHQCRHNLTYWRNQAYLGFGMGATSYTYGQRVSRPRTLKTYGAWVQQYQAAGGRHGEAPTPPSEQLLDRLMVGLRLREGIPGEEIQALCDEATWRRLYGYLRPYIQQGWVEGLWTDGDAKATPDSKTLPPVNPPALATLKQLYLTDPEGFLFSNVVLADVFQLFPELLAAD